MSDTTDPIVAAEAQVAAGIAALEVAMKAPKAAKPVAVPPPPPAPAPAPVATHVTVVSKLHMPLIADLGDEHVVLAPGTTEIPVAFWTAWSARHADSDIVKNKIISAA